MTESQILTVLQGIFLFVGIASNVASLSYINVQFICIQT